MTFANGEVMRTIDIAGHPFAVRVDGPDAAPALLLSNSLGSDLTMWDDQVPHWSQHFRVVRYDVRGHGATPASPPPYTIERLARDALGVLDALAIGKAHFCGLSMGGMIGMWLLTHAATRIGRAVLANTSAHIGPRSLWDDRITFARSEGMEATAEPTVRRWFSEAFHAKAPATIDRIRAMIGRTSVDGYAGCCAAIRDMDQRESIRAIRNPVLVIVGASDPSTPPDSGRAIHAAIDGSELAVLDAAHLSNVEQPAAFEDAVARFLLSRQPARQSTPVRSAPPMKSSPAHPLEEHHEHERFMRAALAEARKALDEGNIPVGAVVVHDGEIVSAGRNAVESARNDLFHAEHAAVAGVPHVLWARRRSCTVYTTMEPCAMCLGAIVYSAIDRIVWGASDPLSATLATVEVTPYYRQRRLVLLGGVLEAECQALLNAYVERYPGRSYLYKPLIGGAIARRGGR